MAKLKIHVIYEHGQDFRPYSVSYIRLLRPLSHPTLQSFINLSFDSDFSDEQVDIVILDRLWHPNATLLDIEDLVSRIRRAGARLIYTLDDNFFALAGMQFASLPDDFVSITGFLLRQADGVIVSTPALREFLLDLNPKIMVIPNALDERLLIKRYPAETGRLFPAERTVIGYMGTFTHDEDILMILPALKALKQRHSERVEFQVVGAIRNEATKTALSDLPVRYMAPRPHENGYPLFMLWWTSQVNWDIAISPLQDSAFTKYKSDIKMLDYAAIGAAGIFSNTSVYGNTVRHMENGLLVENKTGAWEEALEDLVSQPSLRTHLADNAARYLYSERILAHRSADWLAGINTLIENL